MLLAIKTAADFVLSCLGFLAAPLLKAIAEHREALPRFQALSDRFGFQLRATHYYEPTYSEATLPRVTNVERRLPGLELNVAGQLALLARCRFGEDLRSIPVEKTSRRSYGYGNPMYGVGDAEMLFNMISLSRPRRIIEIGSGESTLMARLAIEANRRDQPDYRCEQICIEPYEASWLDDLGVTVIRERVETIELELFDQLEAGDILFIDSSHVIRPWGDVLREFQEIVPRTKPGVLIQVHDVFTPRDYPELWLRRQRRLWNEQYLLESFLAFNRDYEILCATNWLKHNHFDAIAAACPMLGEFPHKEPGAFWFQRKAPVSAEIGTARLSPRIAAVQASPFEKWDAGAPSPEPRAFAQPPRSDPRE